MEPVAWPTRAK